MERYDKTKILGKISEWPSSHKPPMLHLIIGKLNEDNWNQVTATQNLNCYKILASTIFISPVFLGNQIDPEPTNTSGNQFWLLLDPHHQKLVDQYEYRKTSSSSKQPNKEPTKLSQTKNKRDYPRWQTLSQFWRQLASTYLITGKLSKNHNKRNRWESRYSYML